MAGMAPPTDITMRPWPATEKEELSPGDIFTQIAQLTSERGHLRFITERSLQEEVDSGKDVPEDVMEGVEFGAEQKPAKEKDKEDQLKEVEEGRAKMMNQLA